MHRRVGDKENLHFDRKAVHGFLGNNSKCPFVITVLKFSCVQKPPMNMDPPIRKLAHEEENCQFAA